MDTKPFTGEQVAKRAIWLAYQASVPMGMGFLQASNDVTEDSLWEALYIEKSKSTGTSRFYTDYCFGRMMKTVIIFTDSEVMSRHNDTVSASYQSWATRYPSYDELFKAAILSLEHDNKSN